MRQLAATFALVLLIAPLGAPTASATATPPDAPTGLVAQGGNGVVLLGWDAPATAGTNADDSLATIASYNVYRDGALLGSGVSGTFFRDAGVANGGALSYAVSAVNSAGLEGAQSATAGDTPSADAALLKDARGKSKAFVETFAFPFHFEPAVLVVSPGTQVRWNNPAGGAPCPPQTVICHTATEGALLPLDVGNRFDFDLDPGVLSGAVNIVSSAKYLCRPHSFFGMHAAVVVA